MSLVQQGVELLDPEKIKLAIEPANQCCLEVLDIFDSIHSTNDYLLECAKSNAPSGSVCFAEEQTKGRGRHGRTWFSPRGANIYCSLLWHFPEQQTDLSALSLAVAVMVLNVLRGYGIQAGLELKWPNDILFAGRKLAGILLERLPAQDGQIAVVIGVGINLALPIENPLPEAKQWIDITEITGQAARRNYLSGLLLNELFAKLPVYQRQGLSAFINEWRQYDVLKDQAVVVQTGLTAIEGVMLGIGAQGELLLGVKNNQIQRFQCGEVSVKKDILPEN